MARAFEHDRDYYRQQAHEAAVAARKAAEVAAKAAREARDWAAPRAEDAIRTGARKVKPYAQRAGDKAEHWADMLHGAIVSAAIPAVLAAVDRAADEPEPQRGGGSSWAKVLVPVLLAGAAGAALVAWARRDPGRDDWAGDDEWEFLSDEGDFTSRLRHDINKAADLTTDAAKKAAAAVADVASDAAKKAAPLVDQVKETAVAQSKKIAATIDSATDSVVEVLDDVEDVWEDEGGAVEDGEAPAAKPRTTKKKSS